MLARILPAIALHTLLALVAVLTTPCVRAAAPTDADFPYMAYVVEPDSPVRSGPGRRHYATSQLPAGYAVEVYRHDGAGWCAIRPPEGSFSLVPLRQIQVLNDRAAQIAGDAVPARVGSSLVDQHNAVQVMLERGEAVALAERPSPTNPWVRIAPPAGEFRWIAANRLSRTPPTEVNGNAATAGTTTAAWQSPSLAKTPPPEAVRRIALPEPADDAPADADPFAHLAATVPTAPQAQFASGSNPQWLPEPLAANAGAAGSAASSTSDDVEIIPGSPAAIAQAQYQEPSNAAAPTVIDAPTHTAAGQPRIRFEGLSAPPAKPTGPLDPRVAEMQLRLSQIVLGAPAAWQFSGLRDETAALLADDPSPERRAQLRDLLDRIATFENIQARYRALPADTQVLANLAPPAATPLAGAHGAADDAAPESEVLARIRSDLGVGQPDNGITPTPGGPPAAYEAKYDAVGTLKPVVSRRPNAPQYALIDDRGEVVTFVTAPPDMNLQAYLGRRIGVLGQRGFMPEYRRAHVAASRVATLDETVVR